MMFFPKTKIQAAADDVAAHTELEVFVNDSDILVIGAHAQAINEFESRLAARSMEWDEATVDGVDLLRTLTDIQDNRIEFRRRANDEWQARYGIAATGK